MSAEQIGATLDTWTGATVAVVTAQQVSANLPPPGRGRPPGRLDSPTRLWLMLVAAVSALLAVGCVVGVGLADRESTATRTANSTEVLYADVQDLSYSLADANATAATALLAGAETPAQFTTRFDDDITHAEDLLAQASQSVAGDSYASRELTYLAEQIPVYTGLVGQAEADNRFGYPVSGAYLHQASTLLTGSMLAEAGDVIAEQGTATDAGIGSASSFAPWILAVVLIALAALWVVGRRLAAMSHRRFNLGLLGATVVALALFVWSLAAFGAAGGHADAARADYAAAAQAQTETSQLAVAETQVALQQIDRGEDQGTDAAAARAALAQAAPAPGRPGAADAAARSAAGSAYAALNTCAGKAIELATGGQYSAAVAATVGSGADVGKGGCEPDAGRLHDDLLQVHDINEKQFDRDMSDLASDEAGSGALPVGVAAGLLGAAAAAYGINRRLGEFR